MDAATQGGEQSEDQAGPTKTEERVDLRVAQSVEDDETVGAFAAAALMVHYVERTVCKPAASGGGRRGKETLRPSEMRTKGCLIRYRAISRFISSGMCRVPRSIIDAHYFRALCETPPCRHHRRACELQHDLSSRLLWVHIQYI